jgi:hypothetical protein
VFIDGVLIPLNKKPKSLGINHSSSFVPIPQLESAVGKGNKGVQLLKAICSQSWGDKETLTQTYKSILKPQMTFGAPIWYPRVDPGSSALAKLQAIQTNMLHVVTEGHKITDRDHLLAEIGVLFMPEQLELACA